jgi:hypothetical protein
MRGPSPKWAQNRSENALNSTGQGLIGFNNSKGEHDMPLMQLVITLVVVGVLLALVNHFIPMQSTIKSILNGVVVICVVLWLANLFGLFGPLHNIRVGR